LFNDGASFRRARIRFSAMGAMKPASGKAALASAAAGRAILHAAMLRERGDVIMLSRHGL
jgi:hypothetical protein